MSAQSRAGMRTLLFVPALALGVLCPPAAGAAPTAAPVTRAGGADAPGAGASPQVLFELVNQVERLQQSVEQLRGEVEQQRYEIEQLRNRQRDLYVDMDRRLQTVESGRPAMATAAPGIAAVAPGGAAAMPDGAGGNPPLQVLGPAGPSTFGDAGAAGPGLSVEVQQARPAPNLTPTPGPSGAAAPAVLAADPQYTTAPVVAAVPAPAGPPPAPVPALGVMGNDPAAAEEAYKGAFNLLKAGQYDDAIAAFNNYLVEYPGSALADNAQYWLGEAYYVTRQFEAAIGEYQKLLQAYPQSAKAPHAMLKIGYSYQEVGQLDAARTQLDRVRTMYPNTTAARLAQERLQRLAMQQPAAP
ncbi:MAG: tol-pal system protein YbgF [Gammaproteobacteria bacterium]|nr:tol-pal system protein YbgF [Gammaproteobacteria bacterium]